MIDLYNTVKSETRCILMVMFLLIGRLFLRASVFKRPSKGIVKMVATSGTTGYSKIIIYASGDMKLTGIMATTESKVNGYYIDLVVPLT